MSQSKRFTHTGDAGDVIFALPTIKALGGGELYLYPWKGTREPMTKKRFELLAGLLRSQKYLKKVEFSEVPVKSDYDFAEFRKTYRLGKSLAEMQAEWCGAEPDLTTAWLTLPRPKIPLDIVVVNRSPRYHNGSFSWRTVMDSIGKKCVFVGMPSEHAAFEREFGSIMYFPTDNFLEVAKLMVASRGFIGNQSCCNAIAEGLKVYKILEKNPGNCDCLFRSE